VRYFVTGATGLIGSHVVDELVQNGDEVIALTRSRSNARHLPEVVEVVEGDIRKKDTMREGIASVDGVFHIAGWAYVGPGPQNVETAEHINIDGTRNVLELMEEYEVRKGVYTSTLGIHGLQGDRIDESHTYEGPLPSVYLRTKREAHHEVVHPFVADGLPLVTVLPGVVFGPRDRLVGSIRGAFRDYLNGRLKTIPRGTRGPFDHVEAIARRHVLAMEHGTLGEDYIIAGESSTFVELFDLAEEITGVPAPRAVSPRVFGALAKAMSLVERPLQLPEPLQPERLRVFAYADMVVDNEKAVRELGMDVRPLKEGLSEYLEWEMERLSRPN
jgi:dihydroflavonol-4-reductase